VLPSSDRHDDVIMPIATMLPSSDGHDDVMISSLLWSTYKNSNRRILKL
jgi:hypothetical protein